MSLLSKLKRKGPSGFGYGSTAEDVTEGLNLSGKTFVLTGCNSGLGLETLRVLGKRGAHIIALARSEKKASTALKTSKTHGTPLACELSEPFSVRQCIQDIKAKGKTIDAILCNAGIMALPKLKLAHGYELQFLTNHIGHYGLVRGLVDALAEDGRVVVTSSTAHKRAPDCTIDFDNLDGHKSYTPWESYGQSKIANILFAYHLNKTFEGTQRRAYSLHPGVIDTNLTRHMPTLLKNAWSVMGPLVLKSIPEGAATQCYVATQPGLEDLGGQYFADCNVAKTREDAMNATIAKRLWTLSDEIFSSIG